jgi:hypothetical protein
LSENETVKRRPGRVPWHRIAVPAVLCEILAGTVAVDFAVRLKPHVTWHLVLAYGLLVAFTLLYGVTHQVGRKLVAAHIWLTFTLVSAGLAFIHLDDVPARRVFDDAAGQIAMREAAPQLYASVGFLGFCWLLVTLHLVWLGWGGHRTGSSDGEHAEGADEPG